MVKANQGKPDRRYLIHLPVARSLWICGRVLRTSLCPTDRVHKLWTTQQTELTTVYTHSQASRPHTHKLNNKFYIFLKESVRLVRYAPSSNFY